MTITTPDLRPTHQTERVSGDHLIADRADVTALGTILGVWAHPDDETYLSAGLMAAAREHGQRVVVVSATGGELGTDKPAVWSPQRLAATRRWEAAAAMAVLGVSEHRMLGYADGSLAEFPVETGAADVAAVIADVEPTTIVTFGPDGMTGHPDHCAISAWVDRAARPFADVRVLHASVERRHYERFSTRLEEFGVTVAGDGMPRCDRDDLAVHLQLDGLELDQKVAALRAMATQTWSAIDAFGADAYWRWVAEEAFVDAGRAAPVLHAHP